MSRKKVITLVMGAIFGAFILSIVLILLGLYPTS